MLNIYKCLVSTNQVLLFNGVYIFYYKAVIIYHVCMVNLPDAFLIFLENVTDQGSISLHDAYRTSNCQSVYFVHDICT